MGIKVQINKGMPINSSLASVTTDLSVMRFMIASLL
jgi:hypothetical protein